MFTYKNETELAAMTVDERATYATAKKAHEDAEVQKKIDAAVEVVKEESKAAIKVVQDHTDKLDLKLQKQGKTPVEKITFQDVIAKTVKENIDKINGLSPSDGKVPLVMKEITDANFSNGALAFSNTDRRPGVYDTAYAHVWLRNIFPAYSTTKGTMEYLQLDGSEGAAAIWARGTGAEGVDEDKPSSEPKFDLKSVAMAWIAGIARIRRELLDDVDYAGAAISNHLLYSRWGLLAAENKMISDYIVANAVAYSGNKTAGVEKILDAAYGFMLSNYIQPTHVLLNNKDYVDQVLLHKATGSGEYDLPEGGTSLINGRLFFGNGTLEAVPVPSLAAGIGYVVGKDESEFVYRMTPELRMFEEDRDNVPKNLITFRAEERAAFFTKDVNSLIKVTF